LTDLDKVVYLVNNPTDENLLKYKTFSLEPYNCVDFSHDTQSMLESNGINAYTVLLDGKIDYLDDGGVDSFSHAAIAIPVGEVKYADGKIYPTMAVIDPQTGDVMGVVGYDGTQLNETYKYLNRKSTTVDSAIIIKDYQIVDGWTKITSPEIYTYYNRNDQEMTLSEEIMYHSDGSSQ
jgi:hypothetical protein